MREYEINMRNLHYIFFISVLESKTWEVKYQTRDALKLLDTT